MEIIYLVNKFFHIFIVCFLFLSNLYSMPLLELNEDDSFNVLLNVEYSNSFVSNTKLQDVLKSEKSFWQSYPRSEVLLHQHKKGKPIWIRFEVQNNFYSQLYFLRIKELMLDNVRCFLILDTGEIKQMQGGSEFPLDQKIVKFTDSIFPIYLKSGEKAKVYLEIQSEFFSYGYIHIHSISGLLGLTLKEYFFLGAYYGFILFMGIFSIAIFIYLKDYSYLFYFFFLFFFMFFQLSKNSLTTYFFYPDHPHYNGYVWYILLLLSLTWSALFARLFLNLKEFSPKLDRVVLYGAFSFLLFIPLPYFTSENLIFLVLFVGLLYVLVIYPASLYVHFQGFKPAKYFILAWGFFILGILASLFSYKYEYWGEYASQFGSTLEVFFVAIAILSKANQTQKEKESIQEIASGYEKEILLAKEIQESLLPKKPPSIKGTDIFAFFLPMAGVGGDYYDYHVKNETSFTCFVADVSGHGPSAALIASMVKLSFKETFPYYDKPEYALRKMNASLLGNLGKKFVTAMYAHFDLKHKNLIYSSAGHPPIIIHRRSEDKFLSLDSKGQFLGWFKDIKLREHSVKLFSGDRVLIYTDGLIEAFNSKQEMFDYTRLEQVLKSNESFSAEEMCYFLIYTIKEWVGFQSQFGDDITFIVIDIL